MGLMVGEVPISGVKNEAEREPETRRRSGVRRKLFKREPKWLDEREKGEQT